MTSTALITPTASVPAHLQSAGALGNENITADALATPRLYLLQALNEQVIRGNPSYVPGASPGMFLNSISKELSEELWAANLFMDRSFNVNKKRGLGQDWQGTFDTQDAAIQHLENKGLNVADYDVTDTHTHTLALINPETGSIITPIRYSLKGTALRESRSWNSNIVTHAPSLPRFSSIWKITSRLTQNTKGSWYVPQFTFAGWAPEHLFEELQTLFHGLRGQSASTPPVEEIPF